MGLPHGPSSFSFQAWAKQQPLPCVLYDVTVPRRQVSGHRTKQQRTQRTTTLSSLQAACLRDVATGTESPLHNMCYVEIYKNICKNYAGRMVTKHTLNIRGTDRHRERTPCPHILQLLVYISSLAF